jgi:hypothetical protein
MLWRDLLNRATTFFLAKFLATPTAALYTPGSYYQNLYCNQSVTTAAACSSLQAFVLRIFFPKSISTYSTNGGN